MAEPQYIKSLDKGLKILEIIGNESTPVTISQLSRMLDMNRSSVFRLLATLKARGFVINPANSKAFVIGSAIHSLSGNVSWFNILLQVSRQHIVDLAKATGETAHIAVLQGNKTMILDNEVSPQSIGVTIKKGDTGLIHCTAVGKALVMKHSKNELINLIGQKTFEAKTSNTIRNIESLHEELISYRALGYSIDDEEYMSGVRCLGVPVEDVSGKIIATLGISAPLSRMPSERVQQTADIIKQHARRISEDLGVHTPEVLQT